MLGENVVNGELVVPPGNYFVLGDNRHHSADSRSWGLAPRENVVGKPWIVFWSNDAPTADFDGLFNLAPEGAGAELLHQDPLEPHRKRVE
jgi:hypothetical protein